MKKKKFSEFLKENEDAFAQQHNLDMQSLQNQNIQWTDSNINTNTNNSNNSMGFLETLGAFFQNVGNNIGGTIQSVGYGIETQNEANPGVKELRQKQFLTSTKVDDLEKANYKAQSSPFKLSTENQISINNKASENASEFQKQRGLIATEEQVKENENKKVEPNKVKQLFADKMQESQIKQAEVTNSVNKDDKFAQWLVGEIAPNIGQQAVFGIASAINPALGMGVSYSSSAGNYYQDAQSRGMTDDQSRKFGTLMGSVEALTEGLTASNMAKAGAGIKSLISGAGIEATEGTVKNAGNFAFKSVLKNYALDAGEEAFQEAVTEPIQELVASAVGGKDKANWDDIGKRMAKSALNAVVVEGIQAGANAGVNSAVGVMDKIQNGQTPTQQEILQATQDVGKNKDIDINDIIKNSENVKQAMQNPLKDTLLQNLQAIDIDPNYKKQMLEYIDNNEITKENFKGIYDAINNQPKIESNQSNQQQVNNPQADKQNLLNKEQQNTSSVNDFQVKNANDTDDYNSTIAYQYQKSDNEKINQLRQDIVNNTNWNNSEKTHNYVNMLEKIITDKDIAIKIDGNLQDDKGRVANGSYSNGVITINPNSNRAGEFLTIHELTHAIGTNDMMNIVKKYMDSNEEFKANVQSLLKTYDKSEIDEEALADVSGQLFGNQEFINNISQTKPNVFKRIYNEIKYLYHQFTGYKNQDQFVNDLYNKWTEAYNSNSELNNTTKYHISKNLSSDIDNVINDIKIRTPIKVRDYTPTALVENGITDLPMYQNPAHIRKNILTEDEAKKIGLNIGNRDHYHGLGKEIYMKAIDSLDNPRVIFKNKNSKDYIVLTEIKDNNNNVILVPIEIETQTDVNNTKIDTNRIKTVYGHEKINNRDLNDYIKYNIKNNNFEKIYEQKKEQGTGSSTVASSFNDSIAPIKPDVNTNTKYSIEESENNSGSFSSMDNQGRKLSKEQQEYFKNSKVRDENNNLLTMYHSTNSDFNTFSYDNLGKTGLAYGEGFYFTDSEKAKNAYGNNTKTVYLDISKPMEIGKRTMKKNDFRKLAEAVNKKTNGQLEADYGSIDDAVQSYEYGGDDIDLVNELKNESGLSNAEYYNLLRDTLGYDGIKANNKSNGEDGNYWIAFNSNQIKNIDNTNPTSNPDIRYSKGNQSWREYLEKNFKTEGTTTKFSELEINNNQQKQEILNKAKQVEQINPDFRGLSDDIKNNYLNNKDIKLDDINEYLDNILKENEKKTQKEANSILNESTYKEDSQRKKDYMKFKNDNTAYKKEEVNNALMSVKANRNGKRTVNQWKEVANQIGQQLAINNRNENYVQRIAFKSWFDLQPNTKESITRYDNQIKQNQPFQKFTSDDWVNTIYKSYKEQMQNMNVNVKNSVENQTTIKQSAQNNNNPNIKTPGEMVDYSQMERPTEVKQRKFYKSIIESSNTTAEAKKISKELMQQDTYVPDSNKAQLQRADKNIQAIGVDTSLETLKGKISNGDRITAIDIATSERLIEYYSKIGDKEKLQDAIQTSAMAGTEAGRTVQALSILNHSTPEGQVTWIQRSVDKMNDSLEKSHRKERFEFTPEMQQEILQADNMEEAVNNVYKQLGEQVPMSFLQKVDAWRYFSMLGNPRTHIRNIVGNKMMGFMQGAKNKLAGAIEDIVLSDSDDRQFTMARADKKTREFAKADTENVLDRLGLTENKYNPKSRIEQNQKVFKSDILNNTIGKLMNFNDSALEAEDGWGLKAMYPKALAQYLTANNIDVDHITDSQLAKARNFAIRQAEEATFHQDNAIASAISQFEGKNKLTRLVTGAVLPFKKTPMNVAVEGIQYSPVGLVDSLTRGAIQLRKGDINVHQYIDGISKGLTGTGIALLGYALTEAGILKASGGDDEDKNDFEDAQGKQNYSIKIGDKTYSLDWLAPTGIPLFIGSELHQIANQKVLAKGEKSETSAVAKEATKIINSMATAMNPLSEMSMISGLTNTLQSYASGNKGIENLGLNATKNYIGQFVPTALGQVAKTFDNKERSTTSTESDPLTKKVDSLKNQVKSKIPGLRQTLPTKTDIWGNDMNNTGNVLIKGLEAGVFPWTRKDITTNDTDKALTELYDKTQDSSVLPDSSISKTLSIDKDKYRLTNEQYAKYKKQYGQTSYNVLSGLTKSSEYKKMTDEEKVKAVSEVYKYAKAQIKSQYAKENDIDVEDNSVLRNVQSVAHYGGKAEDYFKYVGITTKAEDSKEKMKILENSNISTKSKEAIYSGVLGKNDELYPKVKSAIDVDSYLDFKSQKIENKIDLQEYLNDSDLDYNQKLLLYSTKYTMSNSEQSQLFNYINDLDLTSDEKIQIFSKLKGYKVNLNRITW